MVQEDVMKDRIDYISYAMQEQTQLAADALLKAYIKWFMDKTGADHSTANVVCKNNIAYQAGYYNDDVRRRVERLFQCVHPYFGPIDEVGPPSFGKAFQTGLEMADPSYKSHLP